MNEPKPYDLCILGGGPAGLAGAVMARTHGKTVALVNETLELGGAGTNTGTVPSKTLRETALALSGLKSRQLYGVDLSLRRQATVADFLRHERNVRTAFNGMISKRAEELGVDGYCGVGSFVDPHVIRVTTEPAQADNPLLRCDKVLVATGSSPHRPPEFPFGSPGVHDSDTILQLDCLPRTLAVVGAGVIGSEYACTFAALGVEVHLLDGRDVLLPFLDAEVSDALTAAMSRSGIVFHWKERVQRCEPREGGVTLTLQSGRTLQADAVLVAAGRKSNTAELNLAAAGVTVGERGLIPVDKDQRTSVPHIYAAGDVIGFPALASTSMQQARQAVRHAFGLPTGNDYPQILPTGIYTIPEAAMVGASEEDLRAAGTDIVAGRARYDGGARGRIIGDSTGFLKLVFRRGDMRLLGVHIVGEQATELVHIGLMAMLAGASAEIFHEACFNVPTLGDLYKAAAADAARQAERGR